MQNDFGKFQELLNMLTPGGEYTINREYKDRLFKFVFGNPEKKNWTLSLYNAVNDSAYPESDAEQIQITTIDDVVYYSCQ